MDENCDIDNNISRWASAESEDSTDSDVRSSHAALVADAYSKFPTREALEQTIRERQVEIEAAVDTGFDIDEATWERAERASDEMRRLLPLRLVLQTAEELAEMNEALHARKEGAMRKLDLPKAERIQKEIDEIQDQIDKEKHFVLVKRLGQTECLGCGEMFIKEKEMVGILKLTKKYCEKCRDAGSTGGSDSNKQSTTDDVVGSKEDCNSVQSNVSVKVPETAACGLPNLFGSWW